MRTLSVIILSVIWLTSCAQSNQDTTKVQSDLLPIVVKSDAEWRSELTAEEYEVLRNSGTESPHSGDLLHNKKEGVYTCAGCSTPLFSSNSKFKSGTGWPSFYTPINDSCITEVVDSSYGWNRVEVICSRCGGHQGHVFEDGPEPTGLRFCINSAALNFEEK